MDASDLAALQLEECLQTLLSKEQQQRDAATRNDLQHVATTNSLRPDAHATCSACRVNRGKCPDPDLVLVRTLNVVDGHRPGVFVPRFKISYGVAHGLSLPSP